MKELLDLWNVKEKNFIKRYIKNKLIRFLQPLLWYQKEESLKLIALSSENEELELKINTLSDEIANLEINRRIKILEENVRSINNWITETDQLDDAYSLIDYMDFENQFRGSVELIKERQREYLKYFSNCKHIIDFGCGRGEFLSLLKENNINAEGIELYKPYVDVCTNNGLKVHLESGINYLNNLPDVSIDGLFMSQVVEHLSIKDLITAIELAYKKLADGSYLVMETPNPMTLAIYTHAFYLDPSHNKPVHPYFLQYLSQKAGFKQVSVLFLPKSKLPVEFPKIVSEAINNIDEINNSIEILSNLLYGCQDYAIIAQK